MNRSEVLCFLEELLEDSEDMSYSGGYHLLRNGIEKLQDELVGEDYQESAIHNLTISMNIDSAIVMNELTQIESKLARINQLLGEVNHKLGKENNIKIGVEINE